MFDASVNESHVYYDKRPIYGSGQVVEKTKSDKRKKMYSPSFSELACISVRRFAWAMGTNMVKAVDVMVKSLPAIIKPEIVCSSCRDITKCRACIFKAGTEQQPKILDLLKTTKQATDICLEKFTQGQNTMEIQTIESLCTFISEQSCFSLSTVKNVISTLGYPLYGNGQLFNALSTELENCAEHGANVGFTGFIYYHETIAFFLENRQDIVNHMEQTAAELGTDIISMVQGFGVFRNSDKPTPSEIVRALWDSSKEFPELTSLYNVFAWYALEEVSRTWYRYLEDNPVNREEITV